MEEAQNMLKDGHGQIKSVEYTLIIGKVNYVFISRNY